MIQPYRIKKFNLPLALFFMAVFLTAATSSQEMAWGSMVMELLGGLAIFLFGMEEMSGSMKSLAGERMKTVLARLTTNRFMGAITGAFVTAVIQSSSVTTVLVVGFISAGLMSMAQSIGVIMGANVGTTITAQIVAFKITKAALLMVAIGFSLLFFSKNKKIKTYGSMIMGLGLIFFGMKIMSDAMNPLRSYQPFLDLMQNMENPLLGILTAATFTGLVQSSSATTGIVIVMASQGFISLSAGITLSFGANIGTCVTAVLASIGKPREALRAAMVHVIFNVVGVLVWVGFIDQLAQFVTLFSPTADGLSGVEKLAAETPRQIANAHTIFNVANTFLFIGFTGVLARIVERLVPDKPLDEDKLPDSKYLDDALLATPSLALNRVRLEIGELGGIVEEMLTDIMPAFFQGDEHALDIVSKSDDKVDRIHGQILLYLGKISEESLSEKETRELMGLMAVANNLENIGDIVETHITALGRKRIQESVNISNATRKVINQLHESVLVMFKDAVYSVSEEDKELATRVIAAKQDINQQIEAAILHEAERLVAQEPNRLASYTLEMDVIEKLKRIYYFSKRVAKSGIVVD